MNLTYNKNAQGIYPIGHFYFIILYILISFSIFYWASTLKISSLFGNSLLKRSS